MRTGDCPNLRNHDANEAVAFPVFARGGFEEALQYRRLFRRYDGAEFAEND